MQKSDDYLKIRQEFANALFQNKLRQKLGTKCIYCGMNDDIQYHHIIPVSQGGDNRISNLVPLCGRCHFLAHEKKPIEGKKYKKKGRAETIKPNNYDFIIKLYLGNLIKMNEAMALLDVKRNVFYRFMNQYKAENNDNRVHTNSGNSAENNGIYELLMSLSPETIEVVVNRFIGNQISQEEACSKLGIAQDQFEKIVKACKVQKCTQKPKKIVNACKRNKENLEPIGFLNQGLTSKKHFDITEYDEFIIDLYLCELLKASEAADLLEISQSTFKKRVAVFKEEKRDKRIPEKPKGSSNVIYNMLKRESKANIDEIIDKFLDDKISIERSSAYLCINKDQMIKLVIAHKRRNKDSRKADLIRQIQRTEGNKLKRLKK